MSLEKVVPVLWSQVRDGVGWVVGQGWFELFNELVVVLGFMVLVARAWGRHDCEQHAGGRGKYRNTQRKYSEGTQT